MNPDPADLGSLPLFESLADADLREIAGWFEVRSVDEGKPVTMKGASGYNFFVIQEGTASVSREGMVLRTLGRGDFFGELAILDSGRRTADVVATSPLKLVVMFGTDFRRLQDRLPDVAGRIHDAAESRETAEPDET
jgi:CRP-like cAMP-binding protein